MKKNTDRREGATPREAARTLRVQLSRVYALIWSGQLSATKSKNGH